MDTCTDKIREIALKLLDKKEVEKVIGFANGTIPMATSPIAVTLKQDIEKLVFNSTCGLNLANYIKDGIKDGVRNHKGKIAVIAKGCDSRNFVTHIVENQVKRDQLYIIGVPCNGMIDKAKISSLFDDEITSFSEDGDTLTVNSSLKEEKLNKKDYLRENCKLCMHKNPVIYDELAADIVEEQILDDPYPDVKQTLIPSIF